jgi:DNA-3-methyladenine glycosylase I
LRKREAYRATFFQFDIDKVAAMTPDDVQSILDTPLPTGKGSSSRMVVVRHRGKIEAVIQNAKCIQQMRNEMIHCDDSNDRRSESHGVFDQFLWSFVNDKPIVNASWDGKNLSDCPSTSPESIAMSKALKQRGFKFVGPTTCYSTMQAIGMVIDHPVHSPEYVTALKRLEKRPGGFQIRE